MDLQTKDILKKKVLDLQEEVRDFQMFSKKIDDREVSETFRKFAENAAMEAQKLRELVSKYE